MAIPPSEASFRVAMEIHGEYPFNIETNIAYMVSVVGTLQLALRHPGFPPHIRKQIEPFIAMVIEQTQSVSPIIADSLRAGNDSAQDVA